MDENTNMSRACERDDLETVIYMLHHNNIDYKNAFDGATICEKKRIIVYLDLNLAVTWPDAICLAAMKGYLPSVTWLVKNVYTGINLENTNILPSASSNGHLHFVKYLVEELHLNIHLWNECALICAPIRGHLPVVKYLVEHGANVYANNSLALEYAIQHEHQEVVNYLVAQRTCSRNIIEWITNYIRQ